MSTKLRGAATVALVPLLLLRLPAPAAAHPMTGVGDFYAGMLHPLTAVELALPLIALGLLAGQQGRDTAIRLIAAIPLALGLGAVLGLAMPAPVGLLYANVGAMVVLGAVVAAAPALPAYAALALAAVPAATVGLANGAELGSQLSPVRFVPGLALAGFLLVTYGVGCARRLRAPWMRMGFRVLGSWIAAVGILSLGLGPGGTP